MRIILLALLLTGCATPTMPTLDQQHGIACVTVSTLTTRVTTVYIQADKAGTVSVESDCTVKATVK